MTQQPGDPTMRHRTAEVTVGTIDRQTYYAGTFTGRPPQA